jgi:hypothetical protein
LAKIPDLNSEIFRVKIYLQYPSNLIVDWLYSWTHTNGPEEVILNFSLINSISVYQSQFPDIMLKEILLASFFRLFISPL